MYVIDVGVVNLSAQNYVFSEKGSLKKSPLLNEITEEYEAYLKNKMYTLV